MSEELAEIDHTVGLPQESIGVGGSTAAPEVPEEAGGSANTPLDPREASPPTQE